MTQNAQKSVFTVYTRIKTDKENNITLYAKMPRKRVTVPQESTSEQSSSEESTPVGTTSQETTQESTVLKAKATRKQKTVRPSKPKNYTDGDECLICATEYTLKNLKTVCAMCKFEACRTCVQTNIKTQQVEPRCLSDKCSHIYGDSWLRENLGITFIREDIKAIRKKLVFDRETALLPATQEAAEAIRREEKRQHLNILVSNTSSFYAKQTNHFHEIITMIATIKVIMKQIDKLKELPNKNKYEEAKSTVLTRWGTVLYLTSPNPLLIPPTDFPTETQLEELRAKIESQYSQIRERSAIERKRMNDIVAQLYTDARQNRNGTIKSDTPAETRVYTRPCPVGDCRGYISPMKGNHRLQCGLCQSQLCIKCHVEVPSDSSGSRIHECKESDIASVKEIKDSTKGCPKCHALIFKISGCDVMFCTACNTAFSWTSGAILDARRVHNPHLMAFLNRGGTVGDPNAHAGLDVYGCDSGNILRGYIRKLDTKDPNNEHAQKLRRVLNSANVLHGETQTINYRNTRARVDRALRDIRIQYLLGNIDKKRLQSDALKHEKEYEIQAEISNVYDMFIRGVLQICAPVMTEALTETLAKGLIAQVSELIVFYHDSLDAILERFESKRKLLRIQDDWGISGHN